MDPTVQKRIIAKHLSEELVDALDALFPEKTPELTDSLDQIRYSAGQRSIVRLLRSLTDG